MGKGASTMKFIKFTSMGKIEKYVSQSAVITFMTSRNKIFVTKQKHGGKTEYIQNLIANGYERKIKAGA